MDGSGVPLSLVASGANVGAVAELERNLIVERVKAGMRRARLEDRQIGRQPLVLDREAIFRDRQRGLSLGQFGEALWRFPGYHPSRAP